MKMLLNFESASDIYDVFIETFTVQAEEEAGESATGGDAEKKPDETGKKCILFVFRNL